MTDQQRETLNVLAGRETQYHNEDAAAAELNIDISTLRQRLHDLNTIHGVEVWHTWDEGEYEEYDFAINICEAHFSGIRLPREARGGVCTCSCSENEAIELIVSTALVNNFEILATHTGDGEKKVKSLSDIDSVMLESLTIFK